MTSPYRHGLRALAPACLAILLTCSSASAESLRQLIDAATKHNREFETLEARRVAALARHTAADAISPGSPVLSGRFVTDQVPRDRRAREAEIGISAPIWLPGESPASRRVAEGDIARLAGQEATLRHRLAGQVIDAAFALSLALVEQQAAERRLGEARVLEADVQRRLRAREAAEVDLLAAQADRLQTDAEVREKRLAVEQARSGLQTLTGAVVSNVKLPAALPAAVPADVHPRVAEARAAVEAARAGVTLAGVQTRENPEIGLIARRSRDMFSTQWNTSVGIELRVPLPTAARNQPRQTSAQAELTEASGNLVATEREVAAELRQAEAGLATATALRQLAVERAAVVRRQRELAEASQRAGQLPLPDLIRIRAAAAEAATSAARADIFVTQARLRRDLAQGILP